MIASDLSISPADQRRILDEFRPGLRIYLQAGVGEPLAMRALLAASPDALDGVEMHSCLLPGMNEFDYAALHPGARLTTFMLPPGLRASFEAGRVTIRPLPYSQIAAALGRDDPPFDLAIFQVTPPDADGLCSFGPCSDFPGLVWPRARRRLGLINPSLPRAVNGPRIPVSALDVAIEAAGAFITGVESPPNAELSTIAGRLTAMIPDGAAIQSGIGGAPAAAVAQLVDRRGLIVKSGMVTEGYRRLDQAGALDPNADHVTGLALGDADFMAWACGRFRFADATETHGAAVLAATPNLWALNSALEVDLFGQANLEWRNGRLASGLGGAPDFAAAARRSSGGRAVLALPSSIKGGAITRIVPRLEAVTVSIPRDDTDLIVTEFGVADLRGTGLDQRAERLIAVAHPQHREALAQAWDGLRRGM